MKRYTLELGDRDYPLLLHRGHWQFEDRDSFLAIHVEKSILDRLAMGEREGVTYNLVWRVSDSPHAATVDIASIYGV